MGSDNKFFNLSEVSVHNNAKDCWVIIDAKVYDVTNFLADHPGGDEILLAAAGKDASEEFEDAGHGSAARLMLDEFYVGEANSSTIPKATPYKPSKQPKQIHNDEEKSSNLIIKPLKFLLPFAILGLAFSIHFYIR
ncbi:unnamed protein product [Ilex paraguariensis]|uniref:Cytochrome b5 heme-binding domain-containing protein n=1 Tax=Ilex paraguariensis TaxID=185542 RepID=A0ABC8R9M5_9AQUA